ncbi:MAG: alpha-galactosidase [Candidatus Hydrogenedentes bacterium]|nr:alpha-galactosidase [Candidatus Hydrogenedentota bacterium]
MNVCASGLVLGGLLIMRLAAADLGSLPVLPENEAVIGADWLVHDIDREACAYRSADGAELILSNGLVRRTFRLAPNAATVAFDNLMTGASVIRGVKPEAVIELDGTRYEIGGLTGQPNYAFLRPEWVDQLEANPDAMQFVGFELGEPRERIPWKRVRHHGPGATWPPRGVYLRMDYRMPPRAKADAGTQPPVRVSVHYELYDGAPVMSKWITVYNDGDKPLRLEQFTCEVLAAVEHGSDVETRDLGFLTPNLHVETDFAFCGFTTLNTTRHSVHWIPDPDYDTQVNYAKQTPCLLEVRPTRGPHVAIEPGASFESFRAFVLALDSDDRERSGLAQRRLYRLIAPWVTENPLMMHVRYADWDTVKAAIDQCAEVGFEMVILTFGSGFDIENDSPEYLAEMKRYADYAKSKGIEIGGYSLLASRRIAPEHDVVMPEGLQPTFGNSPCLGSEWGLAYFDKLYAFYRQTGFSLLEHDGSYPGDPCMSTAHPGHENLDDSQWKQWRIITAFYHWCRENGVYLNVPDYYYLAGVTKCAMGYRETNWSLPRAEQVIHTRQNIFDGTWEKTPSMGWMFVPLTEYHGGGAAATIEPLDEHLDHYERMLYSNLAMGVQACYRGPRLYDTERTKAMVSQWVAWFKKYRAILESDLIHGRRADGRDLDWMLHVNPRLEHKGMLVVFNPLNEPVERTLRIPLYYTGLEDSARIREREAPPQTVPLARDYSVALDVAVDAHAFTWFVIE